MTGLRAALITAVIITSSLVVAPAYAADTDRAAPTFTWSGASEVATGDARMSTPGNWAGTVAPAPGQRVALVLPSMPCVHQGSCNDLVNDVTGLIVDSLTITTPGVRPGPPGTFTSEGYLVDGHALRLVGTLRTAGDLTTGPFVPTVVWGAPLDLGAGEHRWRLADGKLLIGSPVTGEALTVRSVRGGGLSIQDPIEVERYSERGNGTGSSEVFNHGSVDGSVDFRNTSVTLLEADLGSLATRSDELKLISGSRPTRVSGPVRLDQETRIYLQTAGPDHPLLTTTRSLDLGGVRLLGLVDCVEPRRTFVVLQGRQLRGQLSDRQGNLLPDGAILRNLGSVGGCESQPVVRIHYTRRALTFTVSEA